MNCMNKKVVMRKNKLKRERERAEEERYLSSLTKEERSSYLKDKEERARHAMRLLNRTAAILTAMQCKGEYFK